MSAPFFMATSKTTNSFNFYFDAYITFMHKRITIFQKNVIDNPIFLKQTYDQILSPNDQ